MLSLLPSTNRGNHKHQKKKKRSNKAQATKTKKGAGTTMNGKLESKSICKTTHIFMDSILSGIYI